MSGETLELTLTVNTPTGTQTVTLSQTRDEDETLQDAAEGLVEDGGADGWSGQSAWSVGRVQVTIPGGPWWMDLVDLVDLVASALKALQSPVQSTAPQGSNDNTVELSVGAEIAAQSSIVQTDEHVSTVAIPSDVGDLSQSAQLDVSIAGPGFPLDAEGNPGIGFQFDIAPGQTPQNVADQCSMRSRTAWAERHKRRWMSGLRPARVVSCRLCCSRARARSRRGSISSD